MDKGGISAESDLVARFGRVQSGVVCDALGRLGLAGWVDGVQPIRRSAKLVGRARTLRFAPKRGGAKPGLNPYGVIRSLAPGEVLVIATDGCPSWIFGENIANAALRQGLAGIVTDAKARDGAILLEHALPCFSAGLATRPPGAIEIVAMDVPVTLAGAQIDPGDLVVGDADGIVIVPGDRIDDTLLQVEDLAALERAQNAAIMADAPLPELMAVLAKKKIRK